jgi:hypothetical protein
MLKQAFCFVHNHAGDVINCMRNGSCHLKTEERRTIMFAKPLFKQLPLLRLNNLQFFGGNEEEEDDEEEDDEGEEDELNLKELLKDPKIKKQHQELLKTQLGKRMRKYEGIDPEEFRRLKEQADKKQKQKEEHDDDELEQLKTQNKEKEKQLLRAERREKRALVKEFAVDQGVNPKLLSRLVDIDAIELDEDGEAENLEKLFEELQEEFPEYFTAQDDEEDEEETTSTKRKGFYKAGHTQKSNKKPPEKKAYDIGKARALARHKREE